MRRQVAVIAVVAFLAGGATIYAASRQVSPPEPSAVPAIRLGDTTPAVQRADTAREPARERSKRSGRKRGKDDRRSAARSRRGSGGTRTTATTSPRRRGGASGDAVRAGDDSTSRTRSRTRRRSGDDDDRTTTVRMPAPAPAPAPVVFDDDVADVEDPAVDNSGPGNAEDRTSTNGSGVSGGGDDD